MFFRKRCFRALFLPCFVLFHGQLCGAADDVYFGGFAFSGRATDSDIAYKYTKQLSERKIDGQGYLNYKLKSFFDANAEQLNQIRYHMQTPESNTKKVMAFILTGERVSQERVGRFHKLLVQLSGHLMVLDYEDMRIVSTVPLVWEFTDAKGTEYNDRDILELIGNEEVGYESDFFWNEIGQALPRLRGKVADVSTLRILNVTITDEAKKELGNAPSELYERWLAEEYSSRLNSELGVNMIPYAKDAANSKLAIRFSNSEMLMFSLPDPTYAIDLTVRKLKRIKGKETGAQIMWVYGAYITVKLYEPTFEELYFEEKMKLGLPKIVAASQNDLDDSAAYKETLKNLLLNSLENLNEDRKAKLVIKKCRVE